MSRTQEEQENRFSSNAIRLRVWEWFIVVGIIFTIAAALPPLWRNLEAFSPPVDYRIPYNLSEDYWLFKQLSRAVNDSGKTLVIGDSVIWGHYVGRNQTLSHYLDESSGIERFLNMGLDGTHPMALYGLIRHYGKAIKGEKIILHLNLLWLSSQEADLQTEKEFQFNHPRIVPQFRPRIPCYTEPVSGRISIVLEHVSPLLQLVRHMQITGFDSTNLQLWTLENPYSNPFDRIWSGPHEWDVNRTGDPQSNARATGPRNPVLQSLPWIEIESSLQWWAFQRLLELLKSRCNDVSVIVGPLNEHVLDSESLQRYRSLLTKAESYLEQIHVPYLRLPLLPSQLYADTSHPLPQGYSILAERIWAWLKQ